MKMSHGAGSVFWLLVGIFILLNGHHLGIGRLHKPGPGFIFFLSGVLLTILSTGDLIAGFTSKPIASQDRKEETLWAGLRWKNVLLSLGGILIYSYIFNSLGFLLATFLLMFLLFKAIGPTKWWMAISTSLITALVTYVIFKIALQVPFPPRNPELLNSGRNKNMDVLGGLYHGFSQILVIDNLLYCFVGVFIGTLVGVLPGIGPVGAMSILLPATYKIGIIESIIMLAGIYFGAMYGGSTTSILVNIPGEASSAVTCLDGYQMARQGRAGPALGIAAFGSFIAGTLSIIGLMLLSPPLASLALQFGPAEYFSLMFMGMILIIYLSSASIIRALMMAVVGVVLGCIGQDSETGEMRLVFGVFELMDGIGLAPFVMGLFGISEVFWNIEREAKEREIFRTKVKGLLPNRQDWKASIKPIGRGSLLGFFLGILPGGGALISTFASYALEKKLAKHPETFGKGAIEGVAGPESANNAATGGAFIPLVTLGIPSNVVMALLLGAMMIHGVAPGPFFITKNPDFFWAIIASMYIGNGMLLVLNLPLIGLWIQLLRVPYRILFPLIILFCVVGAYSINNSTFEIRLMLMFGVLGYLMRKFDFEMAPMVLAFVLGPMIENSLRLSLLMSGGSFAIFFTRPIAAAGMILSFFMLLSCVIPILRRKREAIPID